MLDRRTLATILSGFADEKILADNYSFTPSGRYSIPTCTKNSDVLEHIKGFPELDKPEIFGMNVNAEIIYQFKESTKVIQAVLDLQPRETSTEDGAKTPDQQVQELINFLRSKYPAIILKEGEKECKVNDLTDSMEICLVQEVEKFNRLLTEIDESLTDLSSAINGEIIMSEKLD